MQWLVLGLLLLAAADLVVGGSLLVVVAHQYRGVRRAALLNGQELPRVNGQFAFVGGVLAAGVVVLFGSVLWLIENG